MSMLFIRALNADFEIRDEGARYESAEAALALGIQSGISLAADEIHRGIATAAVEISVEQDDGIAILRSVVSISVAPLLTRSAPAGTTVV